MSAPVFSYLSRFPLIYLSISLWKQKSLSLVFDTKDFVICNDLRVHTWSGLCWNELCFVTKVYVNQINSDNLMISASAYPNLCTVTINLSRQESNQRFSSPIPKISAQKAEQSKEEKKCLNKNVSCFICIDLCILCVGLNKGRSCEMFYGEKETTSENICSYNLFNQIKCL